jgi:hypothetical protein
MHTECHLSLFDATEEVRQKGCNERVAVRNLLPRNEEGTQLENPMTSNTYGILIVGLVLAFSIATSVHFFRRFTCHLTPSVASLTP